MMDYGRELIAKFFNRDLSDIIYEDSASQSLTLGQVCVFVDQLSLNVKKLNNKKWYRLDGKPNKLNLFILLFGVFKGLKLEICENENDFDKYDFEFQDYFKNENTKSDLDYDSYDINDLKQEIIKKFEENSDNFLIKITTSGSTGVPKPVLLTLNALSFQGLSISDNLKLQRTDRQLFYMPINYVYGLSIISTWMASQSVLVEAKFNLNQPGKFLNSIIDRNISVFSGVPYVYSLMVDRWGVEKLKSSDVRCLTQAGGRITLKTKESLITAIGEIEYWVMYGQTEFGARISQYKCSLNNLNDKCVGKPLNGIDIHIKRNGITNDKLEEGEIFVNSPSNCENIKDITQSISVNGKIYFSTGDYGWIKEGILYVSGRNKNFLKISGKRIPLEPIIKSMLNLESVSDCIIETNNKKFSKIIVGLIGGTFNQCETQTSLLESMESDLNGKNIVGLFNNIPFKIYILKGEIPRLRNGKLAISKISKLLREVSDEKNSVHIWL
jgi:acyl-coenzyme A synthetase/AMP-(fatty) acid ligase